jgi:chemotaxis response regulator CheB
MEAVIHRSVSDRPDVVVLDLFMRGMDGMTFLRALRADGALAPVPVIVVTGRTGSGLIQQTAALGARNHFVKAGHSMGERSTRYGSRSGRVRRDGWGSPPPEAAPARGIG